MALSWLGFSDVWRSQLNYPMSKKWQRRREIPWTAAKSWVTSNNPWVMLNTNLFLTAALLNHMHQRQIPPPQNTTLGTWLLPSKKKSCSFPSTKCPQDQGSLMPFFLFSAAETTDILPCPSSRREGISTSNLSWMRTGSGGSLGVEDQSAEAGRTEWGETSQGEVWGFWSFFLRRGGIKQQCFEESRVYRISGFRVRQQKQKLWRCTFA